MPPLTEQEARAILTRVIRLSTAESCEAHISASSGGNLRFARNTVTTAGGSQNRALYVASSFGKRSATSNINQFDDDSLRRAVRESEELARLAPEDPEYMPPLPAQTYVPTRAYFDSTAAITPGFRAEAAAACIAPAKSRGCTAAGFLENSASWSAMMNSNGLFAYHRATGVNYSATVRTDDGTGSGYVTRDYNDASQLDVAATSRIALDKAVASRDARAIEPGRYAVILEPEASIELIQDMMFSMDARAADEGRSFLAVPGGKTRVGEKLMDERVTIYSDPANAEVPGSPWNGDGRPAEKTRWIEKGVVRNMFYSRYWAAKQGRPATPPPSNLIMEGGTASVEDLIRDTARGVLLTRTWYIRFVDPQTLLLTGLTRDGTFFVENGRIKHAVKNFRWNDSPVIMLNNVDALGKPMRVRGCLIPPMRVRDFEFSSTSDAV
ncbi:MAG: TldD/PmbA family protein [Gemmatimonadales bacterium]|nr:TldD/PmbA family protein [Gemmatimonadales bacterium]